jgi:hypothetical protein
MVLNWIQSVKVGSVGAGVGFPGATSTSFISFLFVAPVVAGRASGHFSASSYPPFMGLLDIGRHQEALI